MKEIKLTQENSLIQIPNCKFSATGLVIDNSVTFEEWEHIGKFLRNVESGVLFWMGDWLRFGETKWGEMYAQAIDETGYSYQTLADAKYVAENVQFSLRNENLSFSHHRAVAPLEPEEQKKWLTQAEKETWDYRTLREKIAKSKILPPPVLPKGIYDVIYADPPWLYNDKLIENYGAAIHHYPVMSIEGLCSLKIPSADNSVLFLWVTSPLLEESFAVINAWQFKYKTSFVWDKVKHNFGHYNSVRHEFLLVCTKGNYVPENKKLHDSVITEERTKEHSEKPHVVYEIIETLYPNGKYLELFARNKQKGWTSWGLEVD